MEQAPLEQAPRDPDRHCQHCGTALTDETAGGLCPRCLLEMNFASRTMPGGEPSPQLPPPSPQALAIVPEICAALQFAHGRGVVHRDIKPENILIDRDDRVKIADFGIATLIGSQESEVRSMPSTSERRFSVTSEVGHIRRITERYGQLGLIVTVLGGSIICLMGLRDKHPEVVRFAEDSRHEVNFLNGAIRVSLAYEHNYDEGTKTKAAGPSDASQPWCRIALDIRPLDAEPTQLESDPLGAGETIQWNGESDVRRYRLAGSRLFAVVSVQTGSDALRGEVNRIIDRELNALIMRR